MSDTPVTFNLDTARRVIQATRTVEEMIPPVESPDGGPRSLPELYLVKVTGTETGGGFYTLKIISEPRADIDETSNLTSANLGTDRTAAYGKMIGIHPAEVGLGSHLIQTGSVMTARIHRRQPTGHKTFFILKLDGPFEVVLEKSSGDNGSATTDCSIVYAVKIGGVTIATDLAPLSISHRVPKIAYTPATSGLAYITPAGTVRLWLAFNETAGSITGCVPSGGGGGG